VASINSEWFRQKMSRLESTLRLPRMIWFGSLLFFERPMIPWLLSGLAIWLISKNFLMSIITGFLFALGYEIFTLNKRHTQVVLPRHLKNVDIIRELYNKSKSHLGNTLIRDIEISVDKASWDTVNIGYIGVSSWGWEIIFRILYPLLTKSRIPYQHLLIGFPNKTTEADQKLWEVAHTKDLAKQRKILTRYLDEYGSRVDDVDLMYPTLRERPAVVQEFLKLYKKIQSPEIRQLRAREIRQRSELQISAQLRIPPFIFKRLLKRVQDAVRLREDRRFYAFEGDYYLRQMLLRLANLSGISQSQLFKMSWQEVKNEAIR